MTLVTLSTFSGCGGLDRGLHRAGFRHAMFCEREEWRRGILARHWPGVPVHDDVTTLTAEILEGAYGEPSKADDGGGDGGRRPDPDLLGRRDGRPVVDLLCGGFPCQDLSVAGRRRGLAGARSGLFFEFARIADDVVRPGGFVLIENVPGLLSSHDGRDFAIVLATLAELGFHDLCWRVLDSRHFGVPQRRRRVFILARRASGRVCAEVLAELAGGGGHPEEGAEARTRPAAGARPGAVGAGEGAPGVAATLSAGRGREGVSDAGRRAEDDVNLVADTLRANGDSGGRTDRQPLAVLDDGELVAGPTSVRDGSLGQDVAGPIGAMGETGGHRLDLDSAGAYVAADVTEAIDAGDLASSLTTRYGNTGVDLPDAEAGWVVEVPDPALGQGDAGALGASDNGWRNDLDSHGAYVAGEAGALTSGMGPARLDAQAVDGGQVVVPEGLTDLTGGDGEAVRVYDADGTGPRVRKASTTVFQATGDRGDPAFKDALPHLDANPMSDRRPMVVGDADGVSHALTSEGFDASEDGTGRGTPLTVDEAAAEGYEARYGSEFDEPPAVFTKVRNAESSDDDETWSEGETAHTLDKMGHAHDLAAARQIVRRLTPTECERLQGLPDGWSLPYGPSLADAPAWYELGRGAPAPPDATGVDDYNQRATGDVSRTLSGCARRTDAHGGVGISAPLVQHSEVPTVHHEAWSVLPDQRRRDEGVKGAVEVRDTDTSLTLDTDGRNPSAHNGGIIVGQDAADDLDEPMTFRSTGGSISVDASTETAPTLQVGSGLGIPSGPAVAFTQNQREEVRDVGDEATSLTAESGSHQRTYLAVDTYNQSTGDQAATLRDPNGTFGDAVPAVLAVDPTDYVDDDAAAAYSISGGGGETADLRADATDEAQALTTRGAWAFTQGGTLIDSRHAVAAGLAAPYDCQPDGPRYAALGDAVTAPVGEWIGRRLLAVLAAEGLLDEDGRLR